MSSKKEKEEASFKKLAGVAGAGGVTFESIGWPGFLLKHDAAPAAGSSYMIRGFP